MRNLISVSGRIGSGKDTVGKIIQYLTTENTESGKVVGMHCTIEEYINMNDNSCNDVFKIKKMAGKLKEIASILTGIPIEKFEDQEFKKTNLGKEWDSTIINLGTGESTNVPTTVRTFLQRLGTEAMRNGLHVDTWLNAFWIDYKVDGKINIAKSINDNQEVDIDLTNQKHIKLIQGEEINKGISILPKWIITDCRFENEYNSIKERGGLMIKVERPVIQYDRTCFDCNKGFNFEQMISDHKGCPYCEGINYAGVLYEQNNHASETGLDHITSWDYVIQNDGTIEDLISMVKNILEIEKII